MGVGDASLKMKIIYTITQFILLESEGTMDRLNERGCANFKRIRPGFIRRNSRVGFLSFLAVDAALWWVP